MGPSLASAMSITSSARAEGDHDVTGAITSPPCTPGCDEHSLMNREQGCDDVVRPLSAINGRRRPPPLLIFRSADMMSIFIFLLFHFYTPRKGRLSSYLCTLFPHDEIIFAQARRRMRPKQRLNVMRAKVAVDHIAHTDDALAPRHLILTPTGDAAHFARNSRQMPRLHAMLITLPPVSTRQHFSACFIIDYATLRVARASPTMLITLAFDTVAKRRHFDSLYLLTTLGITAIDGLVAL